MGRIGILGMILLLVGAGCAAPALNPPVESTPGAAASTSTPLPTATASPLPSPTPVITPGAEPEAQLCSPLAGYPLDQLAGQVSNPYNPPPPGSDDPHHGSDLADFQPQNRIARSGMAVQAVLSGRVAGVTRDRFPYGNLVIIETRLEELPAALQARLNVPEMPAEPIRPLALSCPEYNIPENWRSAPRSLYLLYAHLLQPPAVQIGEQVACGAPIGQIGESGNALAPHLHLEVRVGPGGVTLPSMAHYDDSARVDEMGAYCLWRVSGFFKTLDPFCLLSDCPEAP
jgi:murein DD-endopeptidase MepM/ murein hydrolase activator NlpD